MKYCYACGHTTGGEPLFCNSCGYSYNVKLCPKLHMNPRLAEACSQCGSRDLSTPQPRVPLRWRFLAVFAQFLSGILLAFLTFYVLLGLLNDLHSNPQIHPSRAILILLFIALWSLWLLVLPRRFRHAIYLAMRHSNEIHESR